MKILEKVIMPYVSKDIWKGIGQYQQGFREGVSGCHINIGKILARMKRDKEEEKQFFIVSLDVKKAFDSVDRNKLLRFLTKTITQENKDKGVLNILK
jgi:hypothetical protein